MSKSSSYLEINETAHEESEDWTDLDFTNLTASTVRPTNVSILQRSSDASRHNGAKVPIRSTMPGQDFTRVSTRYEKLSAIEIPTTGARATSSIQPIATAISHNYTPAAPDSSERNVSKIRLPPQITKATQAQHGDNLQGQCGLKSEKNRREASNHMTAAKVKSLSAWQDSQAISDHDLSGLVLTPALRLHSNNKGQPNGLVFESDGEDWGEGSLGIRHADAYKSHSHRASTASSNLSISLSSMADSDDGLDGLELPAELAGLKQRLQQNNDRRAAGDTIKLSTRPFKRVEDDSADGLLLEPTSFSRIPTLKNPNIKLVPPVKRHNKLRDQSLGNCSASSTPSRPQISLSSVVSSYQRSNGHASREIVDRENKKGTEDDLHHRTLKTCNSSTKSSVSSLLSEGVPVQKEWSTRASQAKITSRQPKLVAGKPVFLPGSGSNISSHHITALNTRLEKPGYQLTDKYDHEDSVRNNRRRATASEALKLQALKISARTHVRAKTYGEGDELDHLDDIPIGSVRNRHSITSPRSSRANMTEPPNGSVHRLQRLRDGPAISNNLPLRHNVQRPNPCARSPFANAGRDRLDPVPASRKKKTIHPPALISGINTTPRRRIEKSMAYNPDTFRWEGNEDEDMSRFDAMISTPPRPALITNVNNSKKGIQVVNGMVFDPQQMRWFKLKADEDDNIDPFDDLDDFDIPDVDSTTKTPSRDVTATLPSGQFSVGEEFDVGPLFIKKQRSSESSWKHTSSMWLRHHDDNTHRASLYEIYDLLLDE